MIAFPFSRQLARAPAEAAAATAAGLDAVVGALVGTPTRVRMALTPGLLVGRAEKLHVTLSGVRVGDLQLAEVDVRASGVHVPAEWPLRLRAERAEVRVCVEQASLDAWTRSARLPLRIALRPGVISARTGVAGRRLGELDVMLRLEGARLVLSAQRVSMLGVAVRPGAAMPPVILPLPPLPKNARLIAVDPRDGAAAFTFALTDLDEQVTLRQLRWARAALQDARSHNSELAIR